MYHMCCACCLVTESIFYLWHSVSESSISGHYMKWFVIGNSNIVIKHHPTMDGKVYLLEEKKMPGPGSLKPWGILFAFRLGRSSLHFNQLIKLDTFISLYRRQSFAYLWPSMFIGMAFPPGILLICFSLACTLAFCLLVRCFMWQALDCDIASVFCLCVERSEHIV